MIFISYFLAVLYWSVLSSSLVIQSSLMSDSSNTTMNWVPGEHPTTEQNTQQLFPQAPLNNMTTELNKPQLVHCYTPIQYWPYPTMQSSKSIDSSPKPLPMTSLSKKAVDTMKPSDASLKEPFPKTGYDETIMNPLSPTPSILNVKPEPQNTTLPLLNNTSTSPSSNCCQCNPQSSILKDNATHDHLKIATAMNATYPDVPSPGKGLMKRKKIQCVYIIPINKQNVPNPGRIPENVAQLTAFMQSPPLALNANLQNTSKPIVPVIQSSSQLQPQQQGTLSTFSNSIIPQQQIYPKASEGTSPHDKLSSKCNICNMMKSSGLTDAIITSLNSSLPMAAVETDGKKTMRDILTKLIKPMDHAYSCPVRLSSNQTMTNESNINHLNETCRTAPPTNVYNETESGEEMHHIVNSTANISSIDALLDSFMNMDNVTASMMNATLLLTNPVFTKPHCVAGSTNITYVPLYFYSKLLNTNFTYAQVQVISLNNDRDYQLLRQKYLTTLLTFYQHENYVGMTNKLEELRAIKLQKQFLKLELAKVQEKVHQRAIQLQTEIKKYKEEWQKLNTGLKDEISNNIMDIHSPTLGSDAEDNSNDSKQTSQGEKQQDTRVLEIIKRLKWLRKRLILLQSALLKTLNLQTHELLKLQANLHTIPLIMQSGPPVTTDLKKNSNEKVTEGLTKIAQKMGHFFKDTFVGATGSESLEKEEGSPMQQSQEPSYYTNEKTKQKHKGAEDHHRNSRHDIHNQSNPQVVKAQTSV